MHDTAKAEMYFKQALSLGSAQAYLYIQFATFYRDVVKDMTKAKAIIDQGLAKLPNNQALVEFKASLK